MKYTGPALLSINVAWSVHLCVSYYLAWAACAGDNWWLLALRHLATIVALALAMASLWLAVRAVTASTRQFRGGGVQQEALAEHGYLVRVAVVLGAMLIFGILLAGTANLFLMPCM
jgi:hypothetical protein